MKSRIILRILTIVMVVSAGCGFIFTINSDSSNSPKYLIKLELFYRSENPKRTLKTSLLIQESSIKYAIKDSCMESSLIHNFVHFLQLNGARVLDFDPENSILHGCCEHGNIGYVEGIDSIKFLTDSKEVVTFNESKMHTITRYSKDHKIVINIARIETEVSTCADIRGLTQEINYSDSISYLCKVTTVESLDKDEKEMFDNVLKNLEFDCLR